jgi:hypothetical protein
MLTLKIERRRLVLGFEAGDHRRSPVQAGSIRLKTHRREIFCGPLPLGPSPPRSITFIIGAL